MSDCCTLPAHCARLVIIDGLTDNAAVVACAMAVSPLTRHVSAIVLVDAVEGHSMTSPTPVQTRCEATKAMVSAIADGMRRSRLPNSHLPYQYYYGAVHATAEELPALLSRIYIGPTLTPAVLQQRNTASSLSDTSNVKSSFVPDWARDVFVLVCCGDTSRSGASSHDVTEPITRLLHSAKAHHTAAAATRPIPGLRPNEEPLQQHPCRLILLVDTASRTNVELYLCSPAVRALMSPHWLVILVTVPAFAPPGLDFGATQAVLCAASPTHSDVLAGLLPGLCAGVATGLIERLEVSRHGCAPIAPLDVVVNVALLQLARQLTANTNLLLTTTTKALRVVSMEMTPPCPQALVWVMVGEYIVDYYGCYAPMLSTCTALQPWLAANPTLQFPIRLGDTVRWGPDAGPSLSWFATRHARQRRQALLRTSLAQVADTSKGTLNEKEVQARVEALVACVESVIQRIARLSKAEGTSGNEGCSTYGAKMRASLPHMSDDNIGNGDGSSSGGGVSWQEESYVDLINELASSSALATSSLLQYVALDEVDWNMYIVTVAQSVLAVLASMSDPALLPLHNNNNTTLQARISFCHTLPPLVPSFINDIIFRGHGRLPRHPSLWRRCLGNVGFAYRLGMCPNGQRVPMRPGLTKETLYEILCRPTVRRVMVSVAQEDGLEVEQVEAKARAVLHGIGDTQNQLQIKFAGYLMRTVFEKIFRRIAVNRGTHERLRRLFNRPRVAVVVLPLHRSYFDFLIVNYYLGVACLPSPHIASGEDFLHMGKVAELMRGCGAFFMRRSFHKDLLYTTLFQEYIRQLVLRRRCVEFFIEGTRSRTGKTMVPRLGILKFIMSAFLDPSQTALDDVLLLPMSVSYDELPELAIYADELLGLPKPRETLQNLVKVVASLNHDYGAVNLHVAEAISLREYCTQAHPHTTITTINNNSDALCESATAPSAALLQSLGYHITSVLQRHIVITPSALVAAAVECLWPYTPHGLPLLVSTRFTPREGNTMAQHPVQVSQLQKINSEQQEEGEEEKTVATAMRGVLSRVRVTAVVRWLRHAIRQREGNLSTELCLDEDDSVEEEEEGEKKDDEHDVDRFVDEGLRHLARFLHTESDEQTGNALIVMPRPTLSAHVALSICANQLIHVFVDEAVVAVIARAHGAHISTGDKVLQHMHSRSAVLAVEGDDVNDPNALFTSSETKALAVSVRVLRAEARLLCALLAREFPGIANDGGSNNNTEAWLTAALVRLQGDKSAYHATSHETPHMNANAVHPAGDTVYIPTGNLYDFVLQLLLPHVEALYIVLAVAYVLRENDKAAPLPVAAVVTAAHKTTLALCSMSPPQLDFAVLCCKETLSHYLTSLVKCAVLCVDPCCAAAKERPAFVVTMNNGGKTADETLAALQTWLARINALRWHASADISADLKALRHPVLQYYMEAIERAKL